eukprot:854487-Prymnesium_polylepis.1
MPRTCRTGVNSPGTFLADSRLHSSDSGCVTCRDGGRERVFEAEREGERAPRIRAAHAPTPPRPTVSERRSPCRRGRRGWCRSTRAGRG